MTKSTSLQIQSVASNFFLTVAINSREHKGFEYSYCISRQGHVAENSLIRVKKKEWSNFSEIHFILSKAKDMTQQKTGRFQDKGLDGKENVFTEIIFSFPQHLGNWTVYNLCC